MSLMGGTVSFQRFRIAGEFFDDVTEKFMSAVTRRAFGRTPPAPDDYQFGWIGPRHVLDTEIDAQQVAFGGFALLSLRLDRLRAPSNILRAYVQIEEDAIRKASGREFLSTGERRKAREAARLRVDAEARDGAFRRSSACPALIDLASKAVYLSAASTAATDRFVLLFNDTFGVSLEACDPTHLAEKCLSAQRNLRALENLPRFHLVRAPQDAAEAAPSYRKDLSFLGTEFLTWLWFRCESADEPLSLRAGDDVTVAIERSMRLKCDFGLTGVTTLSTDLPASAPEARAALRAGKQPQRAGMTMAGAADEFRFTLDGQRMSVSGLALPEPPADADPRARVEHRFESITALAGLLDALFETFISLRVSRDWASEQRRMAAWAGSAPSDARRQAASA